MRTLVLVVLTLIGAAWFANDAQAQRWRRGGVVYATYSAPVYYPTYDYVAPATYYMPADYPSGYYSDGYYSTYPSSYYTYPTYSSGYYYAPSYYGRGGVWVGGRRWGAGVRW
jgi:hypothetical protein